MVKAWRKLTRPHVLATRNSRVGHFVFQGLTNCVTFWTQRTARPLRNNPSMRRFVEHAQMRGLNSVVVLLNCVAVKLIFL